MSEQTLFQNLRDMHLAFEELPDKHFIKENLSRVRVVTLESTIESKREMALHLLSQAIQEWRAAEALAKELKGLIKAKAFADSQKKD